MKAAKDAKLESKDVELEDGIEVGAAVVYVARTGAHALAEVVNVRDGGVVTLRTLWGRSELNWDTLSGVRRYVRGEVERDCWRRTWEVGNG